MDLIPLPEIKKQHSNGNDNSPTHKFFKMSFANALQWKIMETNLLCNTIPNFGLRNCNFSPQFFTKTQGQLQLGYV